MKVEGLLLYSTKAYGAGADVTPAQYARDLIAEEVEPRVPGLVGERTIRVVVPNGMTSRHLIDALHSAAATATAFHLTAEFADKGILRVTMSPPLLAGTVAASADMSWRDGAARRPQPKLEGGVAHTELTANGARYRCAPAEIALAALEQVVQPLLVRTLDLERRSIILPLPKGVTAREFARDLAVTLEDPTVCDDDFWAACRPALKKVGNLDAVELFYRWTKLPEDVDLFQVIDGDRRRSRHSSK